MKTKWDGKGDTVNVKKQVPASSRKAIEQQAVNKGPLVWDIRWITSKFRQRNQVKFFPLWAGRRKE